MFFGGAWIFGGWGVVGWGCKSYLGPAEIVSFASRSFSHLKQIWFKCERPSLLFLIIFCYISFDQQSSATFDQQSSSNFIKKRFQHKRFPVKLAKFLRTTFLKNQSWWLLLCILHAHDVTCNQSRWNNGYNGIYKKINKS